TATTLSKMANGLADNLLTACYLSAKCPVFVAPAMDLDMWAHPSTIRNIELLRSYKNKIIPVGNGFLASGLHGDGRMAEPEDIITHLANFAEETKDLEGLNVLITVGPTYEAIDPVRFIGNRSSGKMGFALVAECLQRGAHVTAICGPVSSSLTDHSKANIIKVQSASEMHDACDKVSTAAQLIILAAAVADYRPAEVATQKIKKKENSLVLDLVKTTDIAASLGAKKSEKQVIIGFALETNDEINHAKQKLHKKNMDVIVLNSLGDTGAGFQHDTNRVTIIDKSGQNKKYDLKLKSEVAKDIIDFYRNNFYFIHE
ncbi:MAG: bifunctional phosphopantothenoylcysteine decarboxylase/phosphopantothenate--cysteine ligase CoaBC, partial [Saprospiraceae bacterium]